MDYRINLTTSCPNFGGSRWWFLCPLVVAGRACSRRVRKLYLPPGGRHFGCRHCYSLTYESCQTSDKRLSWFRRNEEAMLMLDERGLANLTATQLMLVAKAMR
jgi:hypothetical protein